MEAKATRLKQVAQNELVNADIPSLLDRLDTHEKQKREHLLPVLLQGEFS